MGVLAERLTRAQALVAQRFDASEAALREKLTPKSLESRVKNNVHWHNVMGAGSTSPGMRVYQQLMWCLDNFTDATGERVQRSFHQKMFHMHMTIAALPIIFSGEWHLQSEAIKKQLNIKEKVIQQVIISTPRRAGKSTAVAMFKAASLYAIPNVTNIVFSVAKRQSGLLMDLIRCFYDTLPGALQRYITHNAEVMRVMDTRGGISILRCLPGSSDSNRGVGSQNTASKLIITLEEAAFIADKTFYAVITPLLGVRDTVLIGISTPPEDDSNYYLSLFDCHDNNGEPIFKILKIELQCEDCKAKQETKCPHMRVPEPKWKTGSRKEMQRIIYSKNPEVFMREVLGMSIMSNAYVFHAQNVDTLLLSAKAEVSPLGERHHQIPFVFIGIDPSGGGAGSDTAFVSLTFRPNDYHPVVSDCCCFFFFSSSCWQNARKRPASSRNALYSE